MTKKQRPAISNITMMKLWAYSGARCEFKGCNKALWRDSLTRKEINNSMISHIIAVSPDGPRGDKILSPELAKKFENLMLLCPEHHTLVDSKEYVDKYPVDLLKSYKKEHEDRIKRLTAMQSNMKTHLLFFKANIGGDEVEIDPQQAQEAIEPRYPDGDGTFLDYTALSSPENEKFYNFIAQDINKKLNEQLFFSNYQKKIKHLSIFALGPIPLLIYLGKKVGDIIPADLYQKHRLKKQGWKWDNGEEDFQEPAIKEPENSSNSRNIVLAISLSGKVKDYKIYEVVDKEFPIYEIFIDKPTLTFLINIRQLDIFRRKFIEIMSLIRAREKPVTNIHLFPAVLPPIAVDIGRSLLTKIEPEIIIYDYDKEKSVYYKALNIKCGR